MAFTQSTVAETVFGNKRVVIQRITADAAEANLTAGFVSIDYASLQPEKGQTMPAAHLNKNSSGTAANGTLGVSGTSNANIFHAIILGN